MKSCLFCQLDYYARTKGLLLELMATLRNFQLQISLKEELRQRDKVIHKLQQEIDVKDNIIQQLQKKLARYKSILKLAINTSVQSKTCVYRRTRTAISAQPIQSSSNEDWQKLNNVRKLDW